MNTPKNEFSLEARQARAIMDNVLDAIITIDSRGLITSANLALERIFGHRVDEVIGQNVSLLLPDSDRSHHDAYIQNYLETGKQKIIGQGREVLAQRKDGSVFSAELAVSAVELDGQKMFTGIVRDISERKQAEAELAMQRLQIETINRAQTHFIAGDDPVEFFESMLPSILALTQSDYGFVGEAMTESDGTPYLKMYAVSNIARDEATRESYDKQATEGLEFRNLDNLLGKVLRTGEVVISKDPSNDPDSAGVPEKHPPLNHYLGVPIYLNQKLLGMVGMANCPGGYDQTVVESLQPILNTCAQLFNAIIKDREQRRTSLAVKQSNSFMAALVENLQAGLLVENEQGKIYALNQLYCDMFSKDEMPLMIEGEDCGQEFDSIKALFADADSFLQHRQDCLAGLHVVTDKEFILNDGRVFEQNYVPVIVEDERGETHRSHIWTYNDISAHKRIQETLALAKEEAEAAATVKSQFLATMSHEIRTPMNGVLGMLHLLAKTELGTTQRRFVDTATNSGKVLLNVINDILDFSKLEAEMLKLESIPFNLEELLEQSISLFAKGGQEKQVELLCSLDSALPNKVKGDPTRLGQVLNNLISNAIKFTESGEVALYAKPLDGNRIRFGVRDTGVGMTKQQQQGLFKAFSQADSSYTRKYGGTGLGLAISQKLVNAMGGEICVTSTSGQGADFSFDLLLEMENDSVAKPYFSNSLANQRILIVDDNASMRNLLQSTINSWKVKTIGLAESANDALMQLRMAIDVDQAYDIAILDKRMPGMDGLELAQKIRADADLADMKLMMYSGLEQNAAVPELDVWLTKPLRKAELFNALLGLLGEQPHEASESIHNDIATERWFGGNTLLLVEDNKVNQDVARHILSEVGFEVDIRENGAEAVSAVQQYDYDVVLMDIQMPIMDGLEAARQIRALGGRFSELPIIAMTAHALSGDADKSMAAGMNGHVTKPIETVLLYQALADWVKSDDAPSTRQQPGAPELESSADVELPLLPGIDVADGLQRMCGSWEAYKIIMLGFRDTHADAAESLEQHIRQGEWEEAKSLAHTIKGSGGNISAKDLYKVAAAIEQDCRDEAFDAATERLDRLKACLDEVITGLANLEEIEVEEQ